MKHIRIVVVPGLVKHRLMFLVMILAIMIPQIMTPKALLFLSTATLQIRQIASKMSTNLAIMLDPINLLTLFIRFH